MEFLAGFDWYTLVIIPVLIFIARIFDVSIGTIRVIFIARGYKYLAPVLGFFEVVIWLLAVRQVLINITSIPTYLGYALGFATGTFVGIYIEEKISVGKVMMRIITKKDSSKMLKAFKKAGYIVTSNGARDAQGKVKVMFAVIKRQDIYKVINLMKKYDKNAFYSVEDVRMASENKILKKERKEENLFGRYKKGK